MIIVNEKVILSITDALKKYAIPAYSEWIYDKSPLFKKSDIILYSGEININPFLIKEEFYFINNPTKLIQENIKPEINYGMVFHTDVEKNSPSVGFWIVERPVVEPGRVGEIFFRNQTIRLDLPKDSNFLSVEELLSSDINEKVKDIFLFHINEFSKNEVT